MIRVMMKDLNHWHADPNLTVTVKVIDIDTSTPVTGRIPRTPIRPYNELQPESNLKRASS
jgi:hypothetical protein